ncbi:MAG: phenylalanine--tRNA ligase subunit beta [Syntrophomonas sp.]
MSVPIKWLKEYIKIDWSKEELAHRLTMAGVAVDPDGDSEDDAALELDLTPNRGDCLGLINMAREVSALSGNPVLIPKVSLKENHEKVEDYITVEIEEPDLCRRYAARIVKNCRVAPSPEWMQDRLTNAGIRPINNIVDVTNYVMLESNQPLHAFDYRLLGEDHRILVRCARPEEIITTLDGVKRSLDNEMLLITDGTRGVALAGVMGGENTEINDDTTDVLLESAWFLGTNIRKTGRKLALRSDSSMRFEKGTDIEGVIYAVNRAAALIQELAGGEVVKGVFDNYPRPWKADEIILRSERVNYVLGTEISIEEIGDCLKRLGLKFTKNRGQFKVYAPSYRPDLMIEADLIEEVARLYGYDRIPSCLPDGESSPGGLETEQKYRSMVKELMSRSFFEVVNYSFVNPSVLDMIRIPESSYLRSFIKIANPLSEDQSVMRTILLPGLLDNIARNLARKNQNLAFFEMRPVFYPDDGGLAREILKLGAVVCGERETFWLQKNVAMDFFYLKGLLEDLLQQLSVNDVRFTATDHPSYHPGRTALIEAEGREIGIIGEIHPLVLENYSIRQRACAFELDMQSLFELSRKRAMNDEIVRYPAVERDIALLIPSGVNAQDLLASIRNTGGELLRQVVVFDLYSGGQVPESKKSMAFRLTWQSNQKTLTDNEVSDLMEAVLEKLKAEHQASQR